MEERSMTALIAAFSRAYHSENNKVKIFDDNVAKLLLTEEEYQTISKNMSQGIQYFNPSFVGKEEEALRWIVDHQLSPVPLGRAAFAERALEMAVRYGAMQYLIFAAGFDTFACRQPAWAEKLQIFEIDHPVSAKDKKGHLKKAGLTITENVHFVEADFEMTGWENCLLKNKDFDRTKTSFCSMLGMTYYLSRRSFQKMVAAIGSIIPVNSSIVFDYPNENYFVSEDSNQNARLAEAANEKMQACYSYNEIEKILSDHDFLIFEHLSADEMTEQYFREYNKEAPMHLMNAPENVHYCLAVKK